MSKVTISKEAAELIKAYIDKCAIIDRVEKYIDSLVEPEQVEKNCDNCKHSSLVTGKRCFYVVGLCDDNFSKWQPKEEVKTKTY